MKKFVSMLVAALFCTSISAQQLSESFEDTQFPPEGWTVVTDHNYGSWSQWLRGEKQAGSSLTAADGVAWAYANAVATASNYLITPQLRPATGEQLTFWARVKEYATGAALQVLVSTNSTAPTDFQDTLIALPTSKKAADPRLYQEWREYTVSMENYVGQRIFVAFHHYDNAGADRVMLDAISGVTLAGDASCEAPYDLMVSSIDAHSVAFAWTGDAATYQYVCVPAGEAADWTNAATTTTASVNINQLDEETDYTFYVRSYCSDDEQSLAPYVAFKTPCSSKDIPYVETFYRHTTGVVQPECWTVSSQNPQVWLVTNKEYDEEGAGTLIRGSEHIYASGGGPKTEQVFAMPVMNAQLDTLEVAFDYHHSYAGDAYGKLIIGYMTNASDRNSFVALDTLEQVTETTHHIQTLENVPANAKYIAFRFVGGTSDLSGVSMDDFVVAPIGHSGDFTPESTIDDAPAYLLSQTYCEARFSWYSYNAGAFAIGLFDATTGDLISGIVATTEECDRFAQEDQVAGVFPGFSEYEDPDNHYYCATSWMLNAEDGSFQKGDGWNNCIINVGTATTPIIALKAGSYQVQIYPVDMTTYEKGELIGTVAFELTAKNVENLAATVAADKKTATLTWNAPELENSERLYVSVRSGETVAFDNFEDKSIVAVSPLTVTVEEGKTYSATVQVLDKKGNPIGAEQAISFTVGTNPYTPTNLQATVFGGDNVTFTWEAASAADFYDLVLYWEGAYYSTLSVYSTSKTTTMPKDGTWSWTVQAFTQGTTGKYFAASDAVAGNDFVSKAADIPEDAIVLNVLSMDAMYYELPATDPDYREGQYVWFIEFGTGEETVGYPMPWITIYSNKERAISGVYNVARNNVILENTLLNTTGKESGFIFADDVELKLQFDGMDEEYYPYYTGSFRFVGEDGKTYIGKFFEQQCRAYTYASISTGTLEGLIMWDEDPNANPGEDPWIQGLESVVPAEQATKLLHHGTLYIVMPDGKIYNANGLRVR